MLISEVTDTDRLRRFLTEDLAENAYQLGYLDDGYADVCRWLGHFGPDGLDTVVLIYDGLSRPALFTAGSEGAIRPVLRHFESSLPELTIAHVSAAHLSAFQAVYKPVSAPRRMLRMMLRKDAFATQSADQASQAVQLSHKDTGDIMQVYAHWPDHFFEPFQLETGLYFGARADDGALASIAGIHNISEESGIAAIGNLVTHPGYRGLGFAKVCTASLLRETFQRVDAITLDVEEGNEPAVRTYQHFGFERVGAFYEGEFVRR